MLERKEMKKNGFIIIFFLQKQRNYIYHNQKLSLCSIDFILLMHCSFVLVIKHSTCLVLYQGYIRPHRSLRVIVRKCGHWADENCEKRRDGGIARAGTSASLASSDACNATPAWRADEIYRSYITPVYLLMYSQYDPLVITRSVITTCILFSSFKYLSSK